jgi:hypothetical protein
MSSLLEILVALPIILTLSGLSLKQTKFYYKLLNYFKTYFRLKPVVARIKNKENLDYKNKVKNTLKKVY